MDEKQLLEMSGIGAEDWERTPASVRQLVVQLGLKIEQLEQHLKELQDSKEQLEEKVNRNSDNSHSPPASDAPNRPQPKKKKPTGKKRGGQPGHPGHSRPLYPVEECESVTDHYPETCACCGEKLKGFDPNPYRHQVVEIPPIQLHIEEHRLHQLTCIHCGEKTFFRPTRRSRRVRLWREGRSHRLGTEWDVPPFSSDGSHCYVRPIWGEDVLGDCQSPEEGRK